MFKFLKRRKLLNQLESVSFVNIRFESPDLTTMSKKDFKIFKKDLKTINKFMKPYIVHKTLMPCIFKYWGVNSGSFLKLPLKTENFEKDNYRPRSVTPYYHLAFLDGRREYSQMLNNSLKLIRCLEYADFFGGSLLSAGLYEYISKESKWVDESRYFIFPEKSCDNCSAEGEFFVGGDSTRARIHFQCLCCGADANHLLNKKESKKLMKDFVNYSLKVK